ncbi:MAG: hypothetical protein SGI92_27695 [Bryobacteraceae bacterium]|nr:hypothetical protein [Bryobacteraceae bacterium]
MDPILTTILSTVGVTALKKALEEAMTRLLKNEKPTVTEREKHAIAETAQKMVRAATMDDVKAYSPTYLAIEDRISRPGPRGGAAKKTAAKRAPARKIASKKAPAKKSPTRTVGAKKTAAKKR